MQDKLSVKYGLENLPAKWGGLGYIGYLSCVCHRAGVPTELGDNYLSYITHDILYKDVEELAETSDFCKARRWRSVGSDLFGNGHPAGEKPMWKS